ELARRTWLPALFAEALRLPVSAPLRLICLERSSPAPEQSPYQPRSVRPRQATRPRWRLLLLELSEEPESSSCPAPRDCLPLQRLRRGTSSLHRSVVPANRFVFFPCISV